MTKTFNILSLIFFSFAFNTALAQREDIRLQLERIILHDTDISLDKTPGFIIGIIDRDSSFVFDFGTAEYQIEKKIEATSTFELGSLTKLYTASLVSILTQDSTIILNAPVNQYLPEEDRNPRLSELTILDLLSHKSGFPKRPSLFGKKDKGIQDPYAFYSKKDLLAFYKEYIPIKKVGTFRYSHTNYGLLEIVVESATGLPFEQALKKYLLKPLDLNATYIALPEDSSKVSLGYDRSMKLTKAWSFNSFSASEGIKSSLEDVIAFTRAHWDESQPWHLAFKNMQEAIIKTDFNDQTYSGLGWQVIKSKKWYNVLTHSGMTSGHHTYITCVPDTKTGVVILSNSVLGTQDLSFLILRMINYNWDRKAEKKNG